RPGRRRRPRHARRGALRTRAGLYRRALLARHAAGGVAPGRSRRAAGSLHPRHRRPGRLQVILLALLLSSPLDLFGFTPRATAMAGAMTASDGLPAAFYNPAGLFSEDKTTLAFGFGGTLPALHIDRAN